MSTAVVFLGPSLSREHADEVLAGADVELRGPVAQGDLAELLARPRRRRPGWIGIVDGVYERVPAVWHKEILWALDEGVSVVGAASMGALRAAELAPYGMRGVGVVYEQLRRGQLRADDEVAVAHLGSEEGYRPVSVALVDIRATLDHAAEAGMVSPEQARSLSDVAARLHYPERTWPQLLAAAGTGAAPTGGAAVARWLRRHTVSRKAEDAELLLRHAAEGTLPPSEEPQWSWRLSRTEQWRTARPPTSGGSRLHEALDLVRLRGGWPELERAATLRLLAVQAQRELGQRPTGEGAAAWVDQIRAHVPERDLADLDSETLTEFAADQAALVQMCQRLPTEVATAAADTLRLRGQLADLLEEVKASAEAEPERLDARAEDKLIARCAHRAGLPADTDRTQLASQLGFSGVAALRRAVRRHANQL
ncbi:TfuA-like protein [Lipingzhangella sp. LS1_29]|uniref:TfuA-like protein n=1 Tax=Lipingzhangella rawalii TaxID=2055835 RepID=A0ABU2H730_9ACTN|nr:TfuA-like protein [Lipingzhangella rawalii]MDS1270660.1 TfuA-like protein [Lipingzhangella rawalii]